MTYRVLTVALVSLLVALSGITFAVTNVTFVADPSQVPDEDVARINAGDFPPGYDVVSWQGAEAGPGNKVNWHARYLADGDYLSALLPEDAATLTINDIDRLSYYTKRPTGTPNGQDWWLMIYTRNAVPGVQGPGECSSWYAHRFISNYNDHDLDIDTWTQYATDAGMTFNENSCIGGGEMTLAQLQASYGTELVEMFSVQTASNWNGFDGYMDGLEVELVNGSVGRVNFEAPPVPTTSPVALAVLGFGLAALLGYGLRRRV